MKDYENGEKKVLQFRQGSFAFLNEKIRKVHRKSDENNDRIDTKMIEIYLRDPLRRLSFQHHDHC